jgi:hypothetical protein
MIYSVVPQELAGELYDQLVDYYADDPHVTVIVDRRTRERRSAASSPDAAQQRERGRDRRRARIPGEFPPIDSAA